MDRTEFRSTMNRTMRISVKVFITLMALCTGLYLRSLTSKNPHPYVKAVHAPVKTHETLMITVNTPADDTVITDPSQELTDLLSNAAEQGAQYLDGLMDTFMQSELAQDLFNEEERKKMENLTDLTTDMIDFLLGKNKKELNP